MVGPREWLSVRKYLFSMLFNIQHQGKKGGEGKKDQLQWFMAVTLNNTGLGSHFDGFCFDNQFGWPPNKQVTSTGKAQDLSALLRLSTPALKHSGTASLSSPTTMLTMQLSGIG